MKTITSAQVEFKRVIVRADLDVSLNEHLDIINSSRIDELFPTIHFLHKKKARIIILGHLGRPNGKINTRLSLHPIYKYLKEKLSYQINFISSWNFTEIKRYIMRMQPSEILLLENTRFLSGEVLNTSKLKKQLASLGEVFVNDAFATSHRMHASNYGISTFLPTFAGLAIEKEINKIQEITENLQHPLVVIIGGNKTKEKIGVIEGMLPYADIFFFGGVIGNTFLKAQGYNIGTSMVNDTLFEDVRRLIIKAKELGKKFIYPKDVVLIDSSEVDQKISTSVVKIPNNMSIGDIGAQTISHIIQQLQTARMIFWSGPLGKYENVKLSIGTKSIFSAIQKLRIPSIIGGGDTISAVEPYTQKKKHIYLSLGGSALLALLENKTLPVLALLK